MNPELQLDRDAEAEEKEKSACGVGAIVNLNGRATRESVNLALAGLCDMELRGGSVDGTGDGAGIMVRTKGMREFLKKQLPPSRNIPDNEELFSGLVFLRQEEQRNAPEIQDSVDRLMRQKGLASLGWRKVPVDPGVLGARARESMPGVWQLIFASGQHSGKSLGEGLHSAQLAIEREAPGVYVVSMEPGTMVWKAMAKSDQLKGFYPDLQDPDFVTDAAAWHRRFSTNTVSRWQLAQPFSLLGHNGEVNSIHSMREAARDLKRSLRIGPKILLRNGSDSGDVDRIAAIFHSRRVPLDETMRRIVQPAADDIETMPSDIRDYHRAVRRCLGPLSAEEGPSAIVAMDRKQVVGILDSMGLRPMRIIETRTGLAILTSEAGAPVIPMSDITSVYQLGAGEMAVVEDGSVKYPGDAEESMLARTGFNYDEITARSFSCLPATSNDASERLEKSTIVRLSNLFGMDKSRVGILDAMASKAADPVSGMGNDQPLSVFSKNRPPIGHFMKQTTTDVTNPPLDPIRESGAFDLRVSLGTRPKVREHAFKYMPYEQMELPHPVLAEDQFKKLPPSHTFDTSFDGENVLDLREKIEEVVQESLKLARQKDPAILVFSDRRVITDKKSLYIPPLLIVSAVHKALIENGLRRSVSLVVDSGEILEGHDVALMVGNGADAVNPWLLYERASSVEAQQNVQQALVTMLKRAMSKIGVTSIEGYRGRRSFEAVGIHPDVVDYYLPGIPSKIGGLQLEDILEDIKSRSVYSADIRRNEDTGAYSQRPRKALAACGKTDSTREVYLALLRIIEDMEPIYLRDLLAFDRTNTAPLLKEEVMSEAEIFKNHIRGAAMSHGALDVVIHRAIAGALNELGGMSNSGEGGEDERRNKGGEWEADRSKIRQVASGRFGVDALYLRNADEIEIKFSQGVKPREGGHLPSSKVTAEIAALRRVNPGQELISPPPMHDVYSIEDLGILIQNIRAVNPKARIAVKIASSSDAGVVACGIAKTGADIICISGTEGGTGAASSTARDYTGLPLEIGLADAHQALIKSGLRDTVKIRADGGLKTSVDIVKLAMLGSDQFAFGTALLVAGGECVFCRNCGGGDKKCPAGICAVDSAQSKKLEYESSKDQIKNWLTHVASHTRELLASLGFSSLEEVRGRVDLLRQISRETRCDKVDLSYLLRDMNKYGVSNVTFGVQARTSHTLKSPAVNEANRSLLESVESGNTEFAYELSVEDRSFGATLAGKLATSEIKPAKDIDINTTGFAGQGFGFCTVNGMNIRHTGLGNDMIGGSMSGGKLILRRPDHLKDNDHVSMIENSCMYGATGGVVYVEGSAGQRLGVRNSGATIVAEGAGKYAFEYMTGGIGVVLGKVGLGVGAGMTGGKLYMFDVDDGVAARELDASGENELQTILTDYAAETGSKKAERLLADWEGNKKRFKVVSPVSP